MKEARRCEQGRLAGFKNTTVVMSSSILSLYAVISSLREIILILLCVLSFRKRLMGL